MSQSGYGAPPLKRVRAEEVVNPCSGRYEGGDRSVEIELIVDIDKTRQYTTSLGIISGTITGKKSGSGPWSVKAGSLYFKVIPVTLKVSGGSSNNRDVTGNVKAVFSDGTKAGGRLAVKLTLNESTGAWKAGIDLEIDGQRKLSYKNVERNSPFFKEIKLDIDFTEKLTWPTTVLGDLREPPAGMADRKLDAFSAFEDAGLKLNFNEAHSEQVKDPSPHSPWTKSDLYEVMMKYFESEDSDENIWCMMGTTPPDKRYMGFSFDRKGKRGFGLFIGHRAFVGLEASCKKRKAEAQRRLLHYLVHECGHCLGLKHPFEIGAPESLSWMNYAWKYDVGREPGSFYKNFRFQFSDRELLILRHAPGKAFRSASTPAVLSAIMGEGYSPKTDAPDNNLADDDDDYDVESGYGDEDAPKPKPKKPRPMRKIGLDLKVHNQYSRGQLLSFEARVQNQGKLPALIEGNLSLDSGNLQLYVTKPNGTTEVIEPFVRPIHTGYSKPRVLYTPEDEEGADHYSETVTVGEGSEGYPIDTPGTYQLRAVYTGGRYKATSASYAIEVIADDDDEDQETNEQVLTAATLQASSYNRFKKALGFWQRLEGQAIEKKRAKVTTIIGMMKGLTNKNARQAEVSGKKSRRGHREMALSTVKVAISRKKLINDTNDVVQFYREQGTAADNMDYQRLVMARAELYIADNNIGAADSEFNQMLKDMLERGVIRKVMSKLVKKWRKMKSPPNVADKYTPKSLQKKVNSVLTWAPSTYGNGEPDLSGVGLGNPFSNFDVDQIRKAEKIIEMLFTKYDETQDLYATIGYAAKLQKGREVNFMVLRWALEAFIVHSMDAKKSGIKYPEPEDRDESLVSVAAMIVTKREGQPAEDWMNYWRCDADFNYHHRHWHIVYVVSQFLRRNNTGAFEFAEQMPPHLERQGELFGYMHSQLLARYDADRESWGLPPVQPWGYQETSMPFNAGLEFHSDPQWRYYAPRPEQQWPKNAITRFSGWEKVYEAALQTGEVAAGVELTANWCGHILEPSSRMYRDKFGSFHNSGHGVFGSTNIPPRATCYMNDTATAVRDPIFYRWHKKIDTLWQKNNDYYRSELAHDAPLVTITADDIILSGEPKPPADFNKFSYGSWASKAPSEVACLKTYLGPARKKYEWDNKLSHDKFFYHLRMKRTPSTPKTEEMNLTIRIFICPKSRQQERKRWIEMDKFVCKIPAGEERVQVTRADVHSSVIKRLHEHVDEVEKKHVKEAGGFCECGWPYDMLLPRGKRAGEDYVICVIATDNRIDNIGIRTSCGSMSYCGARGEKYPDSRSMGYPFSNRITYKGEEKPIPTVFDELSNAAYKTFKIENDVTEPPVVKAKDCWWSYIQLGVNDGTMRREPQGGITEYLRSDLVGRFRVLIDSDAAVPSGPGKLLIRFQGRGSRGGAYSISDITLALRQGNTINTVEGEEAKVTYKGQEKFAVPETGLISDPIDMRLDPGRGDYFLTFTLGSPGVYLPASQNVQTSTYHIPARFPGTDFKDIGWMSRIMGRFAYIQCVAGIMAEIKQ